MSKEPEPKPAPKRAGGRAVAIVTVLVLIGAGALAIATPDGQKAIQGFNKSGVSGTGGSVVSSLASVLAPSGAWTVASEKLNPLDDQTVPVARMSHTTASGGYIEVNATCPDNRSITFGFDSFDGDKKPVDFEYSQPNDNGERYLDIIYRLDSGHQLLYAGALSTAQYINSGQIVFTAVGADYEPADIDKANSDAGSVDTSDTGFGALLGRALTGGLIRATLEAEAMQQQDIGALLAAQRVRFQLPVSGGQKEIVEFAPGESSFQDFLSQCHIDAQSLIRQPAAQQAPQPSQDNNGDQSNAPDTSQDQPPQPAPQPEQPDQPATAQTPPSTGSGWQCRYGRWWWFSDDPNRTAPPDTPDASQCTASNEGEVRTVTASSGQ